MMGISWGFASETILVDPKLMSMVIFSFALYPTLNRLRSTIDFDPPIALGSDPLVVSIIFELDLLNTSIS
jgi:hypothetical protein